MALDSGQWWSLALGTSSIMSARFLPKSLTTVFVYFTLELFRPQSHHSTESGDKETSGVQCSTHLQFSELGFAQFEIAALPE
ncbi:hypothetical protein E2C01_077523 [Portunus trituberculatus]|uniref:Uncharacterized protein n=1 Tax=Portunus trituberculatus TaxID=210409 RepID=A0A5B7IPX6_PORTR|nr:hypothetical protein [Portunus trituberculatus]